MSNSGTAAAAGLQHGRARAPGPLLAALDLGTNNCRLLIAEPCHSGFRVVDGYSQIVRLGEGLAASGRLGEGAMARTLGALRVCAEKLAQRPVARSRFVATQACRAAANGAAFLDRVEAETGIRFNVISAEEEARLSVLGCAPLLDPGASLALVIDVGGGSTELSWVDCEGGRVRMAAWTSLPHGVVTLAEQHSDDVDSPDWYERLVEAVAASLHAFSGAEHLREKFLRGPVHYLGASGTVTSLAGVLLDLARYQRARVDGLWLEVEQARATVERLRNLGRDYRAGHPCIGSERADLVVPGGAILEAIFRVWPASRIRVADRGLREGVLYTLLGQGGALHE